MRIATLLPSATEIVRALGLEDQLVAVSHSCDLATAANQPPRVTSTRVPYQADSATIDAFVREHLAGHSALYDLDVERLADVAPEVVISQTLCDVCAVSTGDVMAALNALPSQPTLVDLTPSTLADVFADIERVAAKLNADRKAGRLLESLRARRDRVAATSAKIVDRPRVAFLEWLIPPFNGGHWNPELVELAGGEDTLGATGKPSSTLSWDDVSAADADVVFIACCGFTKERALEDIARVSTAAAWRNLKAVKNGRVYVADGDNYSCPDRV